MRKSREERRALLRLARNYRAACETLALEADERERYTGNDPRDNFGIAARAQIGREFKGSTR
jgi:hypothetical protein